MMRLVLIACLLALTTPAIAADPYIAPDGRTVPQLIAAHVLPDPMVTPGVLNPAVTQDTVATTLCQPPPNPRPKDWHSWIHNQRPPVEWTDALKAKLAIPGHDLKEYELDHLLSIEDGGAPADPQNLWMMVYADRYGARVKDVLETRVSHMVCKGQLSLDDARAALSPNWLVGYVKYVGPLPTENK